MFLDWNSTADVCSAPHPRSGMARAIRYLRDIPLPGLEYGPTGYRGPAVCKIVGISYRQLDYWTTTGLVTPTVRDAEGSGTQRLYAFEDIVQLKVIKKLLDAGVSLQRIRAALEIGRASCRERV